MPWAFSHSSPRSLSIFWQKLNKSSETQENSRRSFVFFDVTSGLFSFENCLYLFSNHTGQHIFPCWPFLTFQSTKSVENLGKSIKSSRIGRFWVCYPFRWQFETFSIKALQLSLQKRLLDNQLFSFWLFKPFHFTKFVETLTKKHKKIENCKILGSLSFSVSIWDFF